MTASKAYIERLADDGYGSFLPRFTGFRDCADLDGAHAAAFLAEAGFDVVGHRDIATNGVAWTRCGVILSTNGFVSRQPERAASYTEGSR